MENGDHTVTFNITLSPKQTTHCCNLTLAPGSSDKVEAAFALQRKYDSYTMGALSRTRIVQNVCFALVVDYTGTQHFRAWL